MRVNGADFEPWRRHSARCATGVRYHPRNSGPRRHGRGPTRTAGWLGREVAVKVVRSDRAGDRLGRRFREETLYRPPRTSIVPVHDGGDNYLVMKRLVGGVSKTTSVNPTPIMQWPLKRW